MPGILDGINVALVTPFDERESIDERAMAALVEDQVRHGMHGVVVNGSTGEFFALTPEERRRNVELVAGIVRNRTRLIVHVGAMTTREAAAHAEHAAQHGALCAMLVCPWYEPLSEDEIEQYVRDVASVGLPLMIYNNPAATGWSMRPELIARLAAIDQVRYMKDTTGNAGRLFRVRELCGDRLELLNGQDTLALLGFLAGTRGSVWGAPNATPTACLELWRRTVERPNLEAARELWAAFYPVNRFFEDEGYVAAVKAGTNLRGVTVGPPRRPILPLRPDRVSSLQTLLARLDAVLSAPIG